jgi:hypothetical protein
MSPRAAEFGGSWRGRPSEIRGPATQKQKESSGAISPQVHLYSPKTESRMLNEAGQAIGFLGRGPAQPVTN